jgi:hypothetical protein
VGQDAIPPLPKMLVCSILQTAQIAPPLAKLEKGCVSATLSFMNKVEFTQQLSDHVLWDVDRASMDAEQHRRFIIPRIMDRGTLPDVKATWNYYGETKVREALLTAPSLQKKTIAFFANQFNLPREEFRAFRKQTRTWDQ